MLKRTPTGFGIAVKTRLLELGQTQEWLIAEVAKDTGKYFDSGYLHRILRGEIATPGIVASISPRYSRPALP